MVYGIIELINFAHGDVFTLGAFISISLFALIGITPQHTGSFGLLMLPIILGVLVLTMALTGLVNVTIERVAYRPLRHQTRLALLLPADGRSFLLEGFNSV